MVGQVGAAYSRARCARIMHDDAQLRWERLLASLAIPTCPTIGSCLNLILVCVLRGLLKFFLMGYLFTADKRINNKKKQNFKVKISRRLLDLFADIPSIPIANLRPLQIVCRRLGFGHTADY